MPHTADVERLFSQLGGIQSAKRCNLTIENFEQLGKLRCNYSFHLYECAHKEGKPIRRKHGHMHTRTTPGIDAELVDELSKAFSYNGPFTTSFADADIDGPEAVSLDELDTAFDNLEKEVVADVVSGNTGPGVGEGVLDGTVYSWDEFDKLEQGISPLTEAESASLFIGEAGEGGTWSVGNLLAAGGLGE
ncbi:hypothetical protein AN958_02532 [Leucoagaricus sp. SymC.cos]|nr:hypothetical protein AN958_02532 [Leucoagaricus sp. SymC.cos]